MKYRDLRTLFHLDEKEADRIYNSRIESDDVRFLNFTIHGNNAFFLQNAEVLCLTIKTLRLNEAINDLSRNLPKVALRQYMNTCLIDEIVLTNDIEGVRSSRQEIGDVLEAIVQKKSNRRFQGIVDKYLMLQSREQIELTTCADIRALYNDLVLDEVVRENPANEPDGMWFRAGSVSVLNGSSIPIHQGMEPESKIIESLEQALVVLHDRNIEILPRVALFHFMFAYIHPFYDGNGRLNRFISSYELTNSFNPLVGFRLSYAIKKRITMYYKAFSLCEHPLNRGDLTPFVILFSELIVDAMESMKISLEKKQEELNDVLSEVKAVFGFPTSDQTMNDVLYCCVQAALFAEDGITSSDLCKIAQSSEPTVAKRRKKLQEQGLILETHRGRQRYYKLNVEELHKQFRSLKN